MAEEVSRAKEIVCLIVTPQGRMVGKVDSREFHNLLNTVDDKDEETVVTGMTATDVCSLLEFLTPEGVAFSATLLGDAFINLGIDHPWSIVELDKKSPLFTQYFQVITNISTAAPGPGIVSPLTK